MEKASPALVAKRITHTSAGCWEWDSIGRDGYGRVRWTGYSQLAHRAVWQMLVGPIADALQLDHLCRNRACVNPDHLEPVSGAENLHRSPLTVNSQNLAKTHCPQGHEYDGDNLYRRMNRKGGFRVCLTCKRQKDAENQRRYRQQRKARREASSA